MLPMLSSTWERTQTALAGRLQASFHCGKRKWPLHILSSPCHHTSTFTTSPALTVHKDIFCGCDVLLPPSLCLCETWLEEEHGTVWQEESGQCVRHEPFPGTTRVRVAKKMSRKEGRSGASATKQSVTLCAVVHPVHSYSRLSISLSPPFPLSNWCPHSCVSPHLPALKLHQPYLLLSLSMIIIIIIVIIVVIMVRIAVIMCYF